jgi:hypothetical protein
MRTTPTTPTAPEGPVVSPAARAWALSLAWGWVVLLVAAAAAVALDAHAFRDVLDLGSRVR